MADQTPTKAITPFNNFRNILRSDEVQARFEAILQKRGTAFLASLLSVYAGSDKLQKCTPSSILTAAAKAAILNLPIAPELGMAHIVPYGKEAKFIKGYKGLIQLAMRTKQYDTINADAIYEGEEVTVNRLDGSITLNGSKISDEAIGYFAYFRMKNGYEKMVYWPIEKIRAHGERYSPSYKYQDSFWKTNFSDAAKKTMLIQLLGKWGLLSIDMVDDDVPFVATNDPRLQTPDLSIPDFDGIDGTLSDPPEQPADLTEVIIAQAVEANLFENEHAARNAMKLCKLQFDTVEDGLTWCRAYRGWRNMDAKPAKAAEYANNGEMPH